MATDAIRAQVAAKWQESFTRINGHSPGISGLLTFAEAWSACVQYLKVPDITSAEYLEGRISRMDQESLKAALNVLHSTRRLTALLDTYLEDVERNFYLIERDIARHTSLYSQDLDTQHIKDLTNRLVEWFKAWEPSDELGRSFLKGYYSKFRNRLFSCLPVDFASGFKQVCTELLEPADEMDEDGEPVASSRSNFELTPEQAMLWQNLSALGLIERFESTVATVGYEYIERYILNKCKGEWERPMLTELRNWMTGRVVPWMLHIYAREATTAEQAQHMLQGVGSRFDFHINKTLCDLRISEIFDIIIDFPDSTGALKDLKDCLQRVDQRNHLVKSLRAANRKRLLQPGADTKLILSQYVATIKCLRVIDPPGVLLFKVADPIRRYLRDRPDTIRSIVANLVGDDDSGDSLVDENEPIQPLQQPESDDYTDPNWEPEPVDAGPEFRTNKPSDIISTLVSIYDSKDLFVKELQVLLAQRLLSISKDNVDKVERERRNIEILKIRFGEAALQVCEVMLKDMTDSKRIDTHIQGQKSSVVHPTIISRHFWPALESSEMVMPGQFQKLRDEYSDEFRTFKPDKKLKWLPHLGTVQLQLELEDRTLDVDVLPLEAAFIELFSHKSVQTLDELIAAVGDIDRSAAVKALSTWVDMGVLKEEPDNTFILLERAEEDGPSRRADHGHSAPDLPPVQSVQSQQAEQMRVYWKFIEAMLTNLGTLPLDRIQMMLKSFAPDYNRTIDQLAAFMEAARREGHVVVRDGVWRLNR